VLSHYLITSFTLTDEAFLRAQGGVNQNSLNSKLNIDNIENDENDQIQIIKHSSYYDNDKLNSLIKSNNNSFSILSTNIQSLNAKFDELNIFVNDLRDKHFEFSAICIQESWLSNTDDTDQFNLDNYSLITQGYTCSSKGGLYIFAKIIGLFRPPFSMCII